MPRFLNQYILILLLFLGLVLLAFELDGSVFPAHDAMLIFQFFEFVYSHYYEFGEVPRWLPNSGYGLPALLYQLSFLSVTKYLVMVLGLLFDVHNVLVLYKVSLFIDRVIFIFGVYLLSSLLYRSPISRGYLCLAAMASLSVYYQPFFNFYLFYLFPIFLYLGLSFIKTGRLGYLALAFLIGALQFLGHTIYFIPLQFYVLFLVFFLYGCLYWPKKIECGRPTFYLSFIATVLCSFLVYLIFQSVEGMTSIAHNRNHDFSVSLEDFLTFERLDVGTTVLGYLTGSTLSYDNTFYIGLLPLVLVVIGIVRSRSTGFWIFVIAAIVVVSFSVGGFFSTLYFHLPGMDKYRYIGLVFGICSLFMLIATGFVVDDEVSHPCASGRSIAWLKRIAFALLVLVLMDMAWTHSAPDLLNHANLSVWTVGVFLLKAMGLVSVILVCSYTEWGRRYRLSVFTAFFILDGLSYQAQVINHMPRVGEELSKLAMVKQHDFSKPRFDLQSNTEEAKLLKRFIEFSKPHNASVYDTTFDWMGSGACIPVVRTDRWNPYVLAAIRARGGVVEPLSGNAFFHQSDENFKRSIGCTAPRFFFAHSFESVSSNESDALARTDNPSRDVIIHAPSGVLSIEKPLQYDANLRLLDYRSHKIRIEIDIKSGHQAILVHADAWDSRWSASINDRDAEVLRANAGFKAIVLNEGRNRIEFEFAKHHPMIMLNKTVLFLAVSFLVFLSMLCIREIKTCRNMEPSPSDW